MSSLPCRVGAPTSPTASIADCPMRTELYHRTRYYAGRGEGRANRAFFAATCASPASVRPSRPAKPAFLDAQPGTSPTGRPAGRGVSNSGQIPASREVWDVDKHGSHPCSTFSQHPVFATFIATNSSNHPELLQANGGPLAIRRYRPHSFLDPVGGPRPSPQRRNVGDSALSGSPPSKKTQFALPIPRPAW
jgi:hypothetical protein